MINTITSIFPNIAFLISLEGTLLAFIALTFALAFTAPSIKKAILNLASAISRSKTYQELAKSARLIRKYPLEKAIYYTATYSIIILGTYLLTEATLFAIPKLIDLIQFNFSSLSIDSEKISSFTYIPQTISAIQENITTIFNAN